MPANFEFIDIIIFIGICQGIFLSLTLQRISNTNKRANTTLSVLIILSTFMLIGRFLLIRFFSKEIFYLALVFDTVIYLFGPLFYLYTRRLLLKDANSSTRFYYHYIPAIIFSVIAAAYLVSYTPDSYFEAYKNGALTVMFQLVLATGILSNIYYLYRSFNVLYIFKRATKSQLSFAQRPAKYLTFFLSAITLIMVAWVLSFSNALFFKGSIPYVNYDTVWATIPVFIYVIGYFSLKQPELFRVTLQEAPKKSKSRLTATECKLLKDKLDSLMINEKVFLQSDLTLVEVSKKINTSSNNVSWLLNNVYDTTFYDFINYYRIQEFLKKVENKEHLQHTILALSMDVGFNSKSTFNKAFKITMNDTPSNYIKKHRAA